MYSANVLHLQASNSEEHFMGVRVQVDGAFRNQESNVCVIYIIFVTNTNLFLWKESLMGM